VRKKGGGDGDEETAFWAIGCLTVLAAQQQRGRGSTAGGGKHACVTAMAEAETRIAHRFLLQVRKSPGKEPRSKQKSRGYRPQKNPCGRKGPPYCCSPIRDGLLLKKSPAPSKRAISKARGPSEGLANEPYSRLARTAGGAPRHLNVLPPISAPPRPSRGGRGRRPTRRADSAEQAEGGDKRGKGGRGMGGVRGGRGAGVVPGGACTRVRGYRQR